MGELIRNNVLAYTFAAALTGLWISLIAYGIFRKTNNIENAKIRTVTRFGIIGVLICFWIWLFIYMNLFPISLAYYEYNCAFVEEKYGVIENIEQDGKDRINIIIDNTEYKIVHSSISPVIILGRDIDEGDTVKIKYGVKSKFIFDIYKSNTSP